MAFSLVREKKHKRGPKGLAVKWGYQESNLGPHPYQGCALTD